MIFVTQTNTGTKVKRDCQEQILGVRSYLSRDLFLPSLGFVMLTSFTDVLNF